MIYQIGNLVVYSLNHLQVLFVQYLGVYHVCLLIIFCIVVRFYVVTIVGICSVSSILKAQFINFRFGGRYVRNANLFGSTVCNVQII